MAYHDAVKHIEEMDPAQVDIAAEDLKRVVRLIDSAIPTLSRLPGTVQWRTDARDLYEQRLREAVNLVEALRDGYDKAGRAVDDYVDAQTRSKQHVADGRAAETSLGRLIADIVRTQSPVVRLSDPLRQWNDLRSTTGFTDWLSELDQQDEIEAVRADAEVLWHRATGAYDQAIQVERESRQHAANQLRQAYQLLPDFLANSANAAAIIATTPGLRAEVLQAARDPNARRPGAGIAATYQVEDDPNTRLYPTGRREAIGELFGDVDQRTLRKSEADILDELGLLGLKRFQEIKDEAFRVADKNFPSADQNDDQNDAFRHAYWNALLTREFGEDWAKRYTTAHEAIPGNQAAREAMDLFNNEQGRAIAVANPNATPEQLAGLIKDAVNQGRTVVIGPDGELEYSDQIKPEDTGKPRNVTLPGHPQPAAGS
jgi:hypothetical protein